MPFGITFYHSSPFKILAIQTIYLYCCDIQPELLVKNILQLGTEIRIDSCNSISFYPLYVNCFLVFRMHLLYHAVLFEHEQFLLFHHWNNFQFHELELKLNFTWILQSKISILIPKLPAASRIVSSKLSFL